MENPNCNQCEMDTLHKGCPVLPCGRYIKPYIAAPKGVIKAVETWQLIVPLQDNQGKSFPEKAVELIRADVLEAFGGDTEVKAVGSWKQDQRIYIDNNIRIEVDVFANDHDKAVEYMAERKGMIKRGLKQEKIYVTYSINRFELLLVDEFLEDLSIKFPFKVVDNPRQEGIDFLVEWSKNPKSKDLTLEIKKLRLTKE